MQGRTSACRTARVRSYFHSMKRLIPFVLALIVLSVPLAASAQFGPIVPDACKACPCGFGGVLAIIQNVVNFIIAISVIIATLIMVWAGGLYMMSATNPESRSQANKMLINAVIGIIIVLSAWLVVDFVMKTLYGGQFGPWNTILLGTEGGESCIVSKPSTPLFEGTIVLVPGQGQEEGGTGGSGVNCPVPAESTMATFPPNVVSGGSGKATQDTVNNFLAMREAALRAGIDLKVTSGYRSDATQVSLYNQNCPGGNCRVATAKPCSMGGGGSNHNSGQALDISVGCSNGNSSCNTPAYRWLKANGGQWNFHNNLPSDPVHWSPSGR